MLENFLAGVEGAAPSSTVLETVVLLLNYTPIYGLSHILLRFFVRGVLAAMLAIFFHFQPVF